jgi:hypothetical protein
MLKEMNSIAGKNYRIEISTYFVLYMLSDVRESGRNVSLYISVYMTVSVV